MSQHSVCPRSGFLFELLLLELSLRSKLLSTEYLFSCGLTRKDWLLHGAFLLLFLLFPTCEIWVIEIMVFLGHLSSREQFLLLGWSETTRMVLVLFLN